MYATQFIENDLQTLLTWNEYKETFPYFLSEWAGFTKTGAQQG